MAKSDRVELYQPPKFPTLFQKFLDKSADAEGMREFAERFGLLEGADREIIVEVADLNTMLAYHSAMGRVLKLFNEGKSGELVIAFNNGDWGKLRIELEIPRNGFRLLPSNDFSEHHHLQRFAWRLSSVLVPANLIQFMWLQIAMYAQSNAILLRCDRCASPFLVGTGTGRRDTAKFCSNACKVAAFRQRQRGV